jgi:hypothetical protein
MPIHTCNKIIEGSDIILRQDILSGEHGGIIGLLIEII